MSLKQKILENVKSAEGFFSRQTLIGALESSYKASSTSSAITKLINENELFELDGKFYIEEPRDVETISDRILKNILEIRQFKSSPSKHAKTFSLISDVHVPFHHKEKVNQFLERKTGENLIINGDFMDCYSLSRFSKTSEVAFELEVYEARALLELFSQYFKNIYWLRGNHEDRYAQAVHSLIPKDLRGMVKNLYEEVIRNIPNIHLIGKLHNKQTENFKNYEDWLVRVGEDVFLSHGQFSGQKASSDAVDYIVKNFKEIPSCIIQGHTHKLRMEHEPNICYVESGCLVNRDSDGMDYNRNFTKSPHLLCNGFIEFSLCEENKFMPNSLSLIKL